MITDRKGKLKVSKELYETQEIDNALFGLRIKVFKVDYDPFIGMYEIWFTSPFVEELEPTISIPEYIIEASNGFKLVKGE